MTRPALRAVLGLVLLALCACGGGTGWPEEAGPERALRLVVVRPASTTGPSEVGRAHRGLLEALSTASGCAFEVPIVVDSAEEARLALAEGEADLGLLGPFEVATALSESALHWLARCVPPAEEFGLVLLVAENAPAKTAADLVGRAIGMIGLGDRPLEAEPFLLVRDDWIARANTSFRSYESGARTLLALAEAEIDAAILPKAVWDRAVQDQLFVSTRFRAIHEFQVPLGGAAMASPKLHPALRQRLGAAFGSLEAADPERPWIGPLQATVARYATGPVEREQQVAFAKDLAAAIERRAAALSLTRTKTER